MPRDKLTPAQRAALLQDYDDEVPVEELARKYGVHHSYAALLARRHGLPTRSGKDNAYFPSQNKTAKR